MRKIVKKGKFCRHCKNQTAPAMYSWFCDHCKKLICDESKNPKEHGALEVTVFFKSSAGSPDAIHLDICGYKCLRQWFISYNPKRPVWFVVLPYIQAEDSEKWIDVKDKFLKQFMNDNPSVR